MRSTNGHSQPSRLAVNEKLKGHPSAALVYLFCVTNMQHSKSYETVITGKDFREKFTLEVGDIITSRRELCEHWVMERRTVNKAIASLNELGLIEIIHDKYALLLRIVPAEGVVKSDGGVGFKTQGGESYNPGGVGFKTPNIEGVIKGEIEGVNTYRSDQNISKEVAKSDQGGGVAGHPIEKEEKKNYKNKEPKPLTQKESSLKMDHSEEMTRIANKWDSIKGVRKTGIIFDSKLQVLLANAIESEIDLDKVCEAQEKFGTKGTTLNSLLNPNADFVLKQHLEKLDNAPQTRKRRPL